MKRMKRQAAGVETSTEGLLDELLSILSGTNGLLAAIDEIEMSIHEASAEGEPVSEGANDVIGVLDSIRPDLERARETLLGRLDVLVGAGTPAPPPPEPEAEEELEEELAEEELEEELPPE